MSAALSASIGVFGGSGFYDFLDDVERVTVPTPYGDPADDVHIGTIGDRRVAFLPRHGAHHEYPPHRVNFRANLWAMHQLGVHQIIGPFAAGSLRSHIAPGDFVVCDQLVDRTTGRVDTYFDGPSVQHVSFADPYCASLGAAAVAAGRRLGITVHDGGTVVVIQGPRFATRAESRWYRAQGWDVINMTQYPEAYLARELGICYAGVALVTDYDTGVEDDPNVAPVTQAAVFAFFRENVNRVRDLLLALIPDLPNECATGHAVPPLPEPPLPDSLPTH